MNRNGWSICSGIRSRDFSQQRGNNPPGWICRRRTGRRMVHGSKVFQSRVDGQASEGRSGYADPVDSPGKPRCSSPSPLAPHPRPSLVLPQPPSQGRRRVPHSRQENPSTPLDGTLLAPDDLKTLSENRGIICIMPNHYLRGSEAQEWDMLSKPFAHEEDGRWDYPKPGGPGTS